MSEICTGQSEQLTERPFILNSAMNSATRHHDDDGEWTF